MAAAAPLIADPIVRNRGTLVGSLCHADPQGDWASVVTALGGHVDRAQGPNGQRAIPVDRLRHAARSRTCSATTRSPSRPSSRRRRRKPPAATSSSSAASVTSPPSASPSRSRRSGGSVIRAGHRAHRCGRLDHRRHRGGAGARRQHARPPIASRRPPSWRRRPPGRAPTTAAAPRSSGTSCAPSWCASSPASRDSAERAA